MSSLRRALPAVLAAFTLQGCGAGDDSGSSGVETAPAQPSDAVGDRDPRLGNALALLSRGEYPAARELARRVLQEHPRSARSEFLIALSFHKEKRYDHARRLFSALVERDAAFPGRESVDHFLGWALYHLGDLDASRGSFRRHLKSSPGFPDSIFGLGLVALEQDRLAEARTRFEHALALLLRDPGKRSRAGRVAMRLGDVDAREGKWAEARQRFETATRLAPALKSARYKLEHAGRQASRSTIASRSTTGVSEGPARLRFTSLDASSTGLDVVMTSGRAPSTEILEVKGGGIALIDFDSDGDLDVFVPNGATLDNPEEGPGCRLYENQGSLQFRDVTERAGLSLRRWSFGVAVADFDGDGRDDIHVACFGPNVLLRNVGDGRFEDVSRQAGIGNSGWSTGCAFGDLDGDGDLDLYVCNYVSFDPAKPPRRASFKNVPVLGGPIGLPAQHDVVYENLGDGRFRDVSEAWGFRAAKPAYALNVAVVDLDHDGRQDVFVANDSMASYLFSRGDAESERFREIGLESGVALSGDGLAQATMGIALADVDGNGFADLFTTNFSGDSNTLHLNRGDALFDDRTSAYGLGRVSMTFLGWACGFFDFDLDGDEDLLVFNGHVFPQATRERFDSPYEQTPLLFERRGERFERVEDGAGDWLTVARRDRTAAFGDMDGDGDVDVVVGGLNQKPRVLRNDVKGEGRSWLVVEVENRAQGGRNRRGIGSRIELIAGERRQVRWIAGGGPFQSSGTLAAHFGLGAHRGPVQVRVRGPDGTEAVANVSDLNRRVVVELSP